MSVPQLGVELGFYTPEEIRQPEFESSLRGVTRKRGVPGISETVLSEFWSSIADAPFDTSVLESSIRDPIIRYLHRILACTLIGRRSGTDKCSVLDLFCLYCILSGREANLASIFVSSLARPRRGGPEARLDLGPYIGRLAERLGVFDRYPQGFLTPGPGTIMYDLEDLRKAGMCPWDNPPRWVPVREAAPIVAGVIQRGVPPVDQRLVRRAERAQPRPPAPLTLEDLRDQIFARMDRTDAAIRFLMTHQGIQIPEFFREPELDADDIDDDAGDGDGVGTSGADQAQD